MARLAPKTAMLPFSVVGRHRSRLQGTLIELAVVANPRFAVAILILTVEVPEIKTLPVFAATLAFPVSVVVAVA